VVKSRRDAQYAADFYLRLTRPQWKIARPPFGQRIS